MNLNKHLIFALSGLLFYSFAMAREIKPPTENVFRIGIEAKIPTLDPHQSSDVYSSQTQALFYETLFEMHYLKDPKELSPLLADGMPKISKDGKTITIKLKKGIKFHDHECFAGGVGREFNGNDFIYMMERISAKTFISPLYGSFQGKVIGIDDYHAGKAEHISGIKLLDPMTVEIKLTNSFPRFIFNYADTKTSIVPKECVEKLGDRFAMNPVGTGPFIPSSVNLGSKVIAKKNPNYNTVKYPSDASPKFKAEGLLADAGKALPLVDKVEIEILTESQPRWLKFMAGEYEMTGVPKDNYPTALPGGKLSPELASRGVKLYRQAKGDVTVQIFNMKDSIWGKSKDLRHAFALALDVKKIIDIQYSGQAIRAHSIIDPTQWGYDEKYVSKWANRDVNKAKELLAKAGFPDGKGLPPVIMPTGADTTSRQFDELISKQLAEVGIKLQSEAMTWPEMMKRQQQYNFTILGIGYASGVPDADDATGLVHSKNIPPGYNAAAYSNPEVDKLVDEIEALPNGKPRKDKIKKLKDILDDELPYLTMVHRIGNQLIQPWLKNHVYVDNMFLGNSIKYQKIETR